MKQKENCFARLNPKTAQNRLENCGVKSITSFSLKIFPPLEGCNLRLKFSYF